MSTRPAGAAADPARRSLTGVHLVRHGEVHNPAKVLYGRLPGFRLSSAGEAMAEAVAAFLAPGPDGRPIVALRSSPLERAQQTAAPLAARTGLPVQPEERVIESTNVFEGGVVEVGAGALRKPAVWRHLTNPFRPSWGEPYAEVAARMLAAVADARAAAVAAGGDAVLISHQLPVYVTRRAAEGRPLWHRPDRRLCALASVTTLLYDGAALVGVRYREPAAHIPPTSTTGSVGA